MDSACSVREAWARRTDYKPNSAQISRGLEDAEESVRTIWRNRFKAGEDDSQDNEEQRSPVI